MRVDLSDFFETYYEVLAKHFRPTTLYFWMSGKRSPISKMTAKLLILLRRYGILDSLIDLLEDRLEGSGD